MDLLKFTKVFLLTLPAFLAVDALWLGVVARKMISNHMAPFSLTLRWFPGILVYVLLVAGTVLFSVQLADGSLTKALLYGAAFGLVAYGTYDLTNYATLEHWSPTMTIIDMIWGASVMSFTALVATLINNWLS